MTNNTLQQALRFGKGAAEVSSIVAGGDHARLAGNYIVGLVAEVARLSAELEAARKHEVALDIQLQDTQADYGTIHWELEQANTEVAALKARIEAGIAASENTRRAWKLEGWKREVNEFPLADTLDEIVAALRGEP